jgi:hypothetical protein
MSTTIFTPQYHQKLHQELTTLNMIILEAQGNQHNRDIWTYIWGTSQYSSSKFYTLNFASIVAHAPFKWIWKSKVSKKIKIFIWLLFRDRINSRSLLRRKNYKIDRDDYSCVLCNLNVEELSYHLIFQCPFNYECWDYLGINWDHSLQFFDTIWKAKQDSHIGLFMEVFSITGGREIVKKLEEWCPTSGLGRTAFYLAPKAKCID